MPGIGLTFGSEKDKLRLVVKNGVSIDDPRVMLRTNEAIQELLSELIPVGGMGTYNVVTAADSTILLPVFLENAIEVHIVDGSAVNGQLDVRQGWYDVVNPSTYVDPSAAHDNPLIDLGFAADPDDFTLLRRKYIYPGVPGGTLVSVTGATRYLAITGDGTALIIQNVPAIKLMILAIEKRESGNDPDAGAKYKALAIELLTAEVKKHQLDPRNTMRRKSEYEADLVNYRIGSMAWTRARLALEVPGAQTMGKEELTRLIGRAEQRLLERGIFKGSIEEFDAHVVCGHIVLPGRVESVLGANICGETINIRSILFKYAENGPGEFDCSCGGRMDDEGDIIMADGTRRRKYFLHSGPSSQSTAGVVPSPTSDPGDIFGTLTAYDAIYLGDNARLIALGNGLAIEIREDDGTWVREGEWVE